MTVGIGCSKALYRMTAKYLIRLPVLYALASSVGIVVSYYFGAIPVGILLTLVSMPSWALFWFVPYDMRLAVTIGTLQYLIIGAFVDHVRAVRVRAVQRRARGDCVACGYPLGEALRCPECGCLKEAGGS